MASSSKHGQAVSTNANEPTPAAAAAAPAVNPDKALLRLLYAMLKQKSLKDIDWNQVASDPVLLEGISNGHAARMRYSRFRNAIENSKPNKRQPKNSDPKSCLVYVPSRNSCRVTKKRSAGARKVRGDRGDDAEDDEQKDADGDTEDDQDDQDNGTGKENRRQPLKAADRTARNSSSGGGNMCAAKDTRPCPREPRPKPIKEDPDAVNPSLSFSSLPSPPMEMEHTMDRADESPLVDQEPLFASSAGGLLVPKRRKTAVHSPSTETTLQQITQALQVSQAAQAAQVPHLRGAYATPDMGVGLGLSSGVTRIHSMPLLHQLAFEPMTGSYNTGGALMMRHHSAGSYSAMAGSDASDQAHHDGLVASAGSLLGPPRARLLTPSSDDYHHQQQQQQQQQHAFYHAHDYLAFASGPLSSATQQHHGSHDANAATPHTQWATTPFASPSIGETLDSTMDSLEMSPYMGAGMDFAVTGDSVMDAAVHPSTSLFAMADDPQQQPQQPYLPDAFAKHSNGWDAMISQGLNQV